MDERSRINRMGLWLLFLGVVTVALARYLTSHHPGGPFGSALGLGVLAFAAGDILLGRALCAAIKSYRATRRYRSPWR